MSVDLGGGNVGQNVSWSGALLEWFLVLGPSPWAPGVEFVVCRG